MDKPAKTRQALEADLLQRKAWYERVLKDLKRLKRIGLSDVDNMLDMLNIIKNDIENIENTLRQFDKDVDL